MKFETKAIWVGQAADKATGATIVPIYQTSTFTQEEVNKHKGYEYSRVGNPTRSALDACLASLEEGRYGLSFSSGLAAEHAILSLLRPGDHVIAPEDMYGGTYRLIKEIFEPFDLKFTFTDFTDLKLIEKAYLPSTKMVWIETPTNPLLKIFDIQAISELSHKKNAIVVVDNTFLSPYFQKPLLLGADIVVHSTTKYINGHSDIIGGAVILNSTELFEKIQLVQKSVGAVPSPFDSWLTLRGVKTLAVRMKQHELNAFKVADFLQNQQNVLEVFFPGLESHPGHDIAKKQMTGFGGVVSFKIKGGLNECNTFFKNLKIFQLADSLGGIESLANYSALMTHDYFPKELRQKIGVTDNLIRLSIGIEHIDDLLEDLKNALEHDNYASFINPCPDNKMKKPEKPVKILIADSQYLITESLKLILQEGDRFYVNKVVTEKNDLVNTLNLNDTSLLIIDPAMVDIAGLSELKEIKCNFPDLKLLIVTNSVSKKELHEFNTIGINNIILKTEGKEEIIEALNATINGKKHYSNELLDLLFEPNERKIIGEETGQLTNSELEIVRLIAEGLTTKEIATRKFISFHTVISHRKNIFRKLGVTSISELIMYSIKAGWINTIEYHI